ncbi:HAMP domain-containing protein [Streptomyces lunaelactis]|uniref:sensor histidine kinase n=1 Tax=Streptomyces lunaelactis TaxID=1535768 RepID=UPI001584F8E8|nr:HAMP domain-containing sensor histidine kinase [Streptomyces lunaelactis]NUK36391.1 HAMP domain-containing protein [Streptomyces lunaelactis]NUK44071.1 HAMP domain-containing protein [Streptomyces lunaelactis]NUK72154.1 HAMP domain-containing protein [Streptomyces lunaelactis]NUK80062.1 HAMP domain-containing protein [Streptomyces lunaelactis]NUK93439.1 HAMP domain-containing protein [Streptomyces lunaelactis]
MSSLRGRRWSLRTRLVVSAVALIAVVAAVIGTVTTIAYRTYLYGQLDTQLATVGVRASGPPGPVEERPLGMPSDRGPLDFVIGGGTPVGTVGAQLAKDGTVSEAVASVERKTDALEPLASPLTETQSKALAQVARDGRPHTLELPGRGDYRVEYVTGVRGSYLVGVPLSDVQDALATLVLVEVSVTGAGLIAAGIAGTALVGFALRPLRRVAATATRVSEMPLHSGEVALHERVPDAEADPRTEVGQVGAALNRMLGHVGSALVVRQESETRVRQFVADASHELRTPLASIRGYAELTRRGREEVGADTRHALGRIEAEATRMTGLVEDLLLLARLDAGRPLSCESTDLSPLVVDAVGDARAAGQDHKWRLELPVEPANVQGDGARLHQVLVNLLANARTHTPPGTTVTARIRVGGPTVVLEVEDDGPGIPPALLPHIFERFARGDASRSRHAGSTGLGLAIVQAVVAAHGGRVGVRSEPGHTVFAVGLPAGAAGTSGAGWTAGAGWAPGAGRAPAYDSQTGHRRITQL